MAPDYSSPQEMLKQQIKNLYNQVKDLNCNNTTEILKTNAVVERLLTQYREHPSLLILQTRLAILNSQEQSARAFANRVWEVGGNIDISFEKMYLDDLMNLGLLEMALILIKPRFENITEGLKNFPLEMIKFAIMTGSVPLLNKIILNGNDNSVYKALSEFADVYQQNKYEEHFKNIQKIALDTFGKDMCAYDYNLYTNRGFTDLEIVIYFSNYNLELKRYHILLDGKITGYFLTSGAQRIHNLNFVMKNIKDHPKF